jgi:hypothetical protein
MRRGRRIAKFAMAALLSVSVIGGAQSARPVIAAAPFEGPVPRANCANNNPAYLEPALQGEVTLADRNSGRSQLGYRCNLELVGQYQGIGAGWQNAWYGSCDYYDTAQNATAPGVQVLDVSDPAHPKPTANLTTPAMLGPWESLKVNQQRGLLAGVAAYDGAGNGPLFFDVYDVTGDCTHPTLKASVPLNLPIGHEGNWSADGKTYYGSALFTDSIAAIDVSNPSSPSLITVIPHDTHGLATSDDGNRLYLANFVTAGGGVSPSNGLDILDVSQIQSRATAPVVTSTVGSVTWTDGTTAQHPVPISYGGKPFILFSDEGGSGMARIIDISDEQHPAVVSKLKLEINMPANAAVASADSTGDGVFNYQGHYCAVDQEHDPTAAACGYFESGIRVFDIRDPYHPREIAYYNPPAQVQKHGQLAGSEHGCGIATGGGPCPGAVQPTNMTADWCSSNVRFYHAPDGSYQLWGQCQDNGFMALRFTNGAYPLTTTAVVAEVPGSMVTLPLVGLVAALVMSGRRRRIRRP